MKMIPVILMALTMAAPLSALAANKIFPYQYFIDDLPNGLRVITIPTDYPNLVASYIVVRTGSRNEVEPGKSGFAHLFEHLMFRGTEKFPSQEYDRILKNAGADQNAYTSDDRTVYHTVFSKEDFDQIMVLEADRFQNLKVPIDLFKTETRAVLGEYNKNSSNPLNKLLEVARDTAFTTHTYKHTTMGFIQDVENMPNMYDYSLQFFQRYYRPENTVVMIVGDVSHDLVLSTVKKYWSDWKRGDFKPQIPSEPQQTAERKAHVDWQTPTLPWVLVAYKGPAYSDEQKDMPAMDLISNLGFSESSELYQRLVVKEQKVDALLPIFQDEADPYLVMVVARVKNPNDVDYVREQIEKTFDSFKSDRVSREKLQQVKSHLKYEFALRLDNSDAIASNLASYIALRRTPETINKLYDIYATISPEDLQSMANKYFVADHRTIVTLSRADASRANASHEEKH